MRMFPEIFEIGIFWGMYINNTTFVPLYTVQLLFIMKIQHVFAPLLRVQDVYRIAYLDFYYLPIAYMRVYRTLDSFKPSPSFSFCSLKSTQRIKSCLALRSLYDRNGCSLVAVYWNELKILIFLYGLLSETLLENKN